MFVLVVVFISCITGGIYGIIHDQISYTISPEYYTKFKFYQFGLLEEGSDHVNEAFEKPRAAAALVGFLATWWMGVPIGLVLGLLGYSAQKNRTIICIKAVLITVAIALVFGLIGYAIGKFFLAELDFNWPLPENVVDQNNFIVVGTMHNFSYLGGLAGLLFGSIYILKQKRRLKPNQRDYI